MLAVATAALGIAGLSACASGVGSTSGAPNTDGSNPDASDPDASADSDALDAGVAYAASADRGALCGGEHLELTGHGLADVERVAFGDVRVRVEQASESRVLVRVPHAHDYRPSRVPIRVVGAAGARRTGLEWRYRVETARDRQLRYAFEHWKRYNSEFWDFNSVGGDCGNFVNQTLLARGWQMTDDWRTGGDFGSTTATWFNGPQMDAWMGARLERIPLGAGQRGRSRLRVGDVAFFDWEANGVPNHTMIVSDVRERADGTWAVAFCGHNLDIRYRDLDDDVLREYPDARLWCYAVRSSSTPV